MSTSSSSDATDKTGDSVVSAGKPLSSKCDVLLKGGGVDDQGIVYILDLEETFDSTFIHYAQRAGVRPSILRFYHKGQLLTPTETPFDRDFCSNEIVLAYNTEGKSISVRPVGVNTTNRKLFHISDLFERRNTYKFIASNNTPILSLYKRWATD